MEELTEKINEPICLSGGAPGADLQWGMNAGKSGHFVIHWSFEGHDCQAPENETYKLTQDQLEFADPFLKKANLKLKRKLPFQKPKVINLLRRNLYQVFWSNSVYAISTLDKQGGVKGGTAWAIQMFVDVKSPNNNLFLYEQNKDVWMVWTKKHRDGKPKFEETNNVPVPSGVWAGIGTRELTENGKNAIRNLFKG